MGIRNLSSASISTGAKRSKFWDQSATYVPPSFYSIATATVDSGGASSITFSSIPSTYKYLQIRGIARETAGGDVSAGDQLWIYANGDSGANYSLHRWWVTGSTVNTDSYTGQTKYILTGLAGSGSTANVYSGYIIDLPDYANANKTKTIRSLNGADFNNANGMIWFNSSAWQNTSAINSLTISCTYGAFAQYSQFALYGAN